MPSDEDAVAALAKREETYPLIQELLKLAASGSVSAPTGFERRASTAFADSEPDPGPHRRKRRKLHRVPAGAADWDVPFPFRQGEGPEEYHRDWRTERARRLVAQLRKLFRETVYKIAVRRYLDEKATSEGRTCRDKSAEGEAVTAAETQAQLANAAYPEFSASELTTDQSSSAPTSDQALDDLFASLLSDQQPMAITTSEQSSPAIENDTTTLSMESWWSILQSFPIPSNDNSIFNDAAHTPFPDSPFDLPFTPVSSSVPSLQGDDLESSFLTQMARLTEVSTAPTLPNVMEAASSIFDLHSTTTSSSTFPNAEFGTHEYSDNLIDPALLALAIPTSSVAGSSSSSSMPWEGSLPALSQSASPLPSISDADIDPMTPHSAAWDMTMNDVLFGTSSGISVVEDSLRGGSEDVLDSRLEILPNVSWKGKEKEKVVNSPVREDRSLDIPSPTQTPVAPPVSSNTPGPAASSSSAAQPIQPAASQSVSPVTPSPSTIPALLRIDPTVASSSATFVSASLPFVPAAAKPNRADVLKRAKERRKQLAEEIVKVKTQLWETTIEQGVLSHLAKHYK